MFEIFFDKKAILHIVKDVLVVFREAFHPSIRPFRRPSIRWHLRGKKTLAEIINFPFCACVTI
jgi:hypothetical protein